MIPTQAQIEAFGEAWHATPQGEPGDRRRAGLAAVLTDIELRIAALENPGCTRVVGGCTCERSTAVRQALRIIRGES